MVSYSGTLKGQLSNSNLLKSIMHFYGFVCVLQTKKRRTHPELLSQQLVSDLLLLVRSPAAEVGKQLLPARFVFSLLKKTNTVSNPQIIAAVYENDDS